EPAIRPAQAGELRPAPWGPSTRRPQPGHFKSTTLIGQGRLNNEQVLQQGGVVQMPQLFPIGAQEIVRCTTLAIRRRTELLGPLSQYDPLFATLVTTLSHNPGFPNHWSQAWVDVQYGLALVATGRVADAIRLLDRSIVAAGQFDHPLTSTALLELGRLALLRGDYQAASTFLHEATLAAVQFPDVGVLEDAFRYGALTHLLDNRQGLFPPLETASRWAKVQNLRRLRVSLLLSTAENLAVLGQTADAAMRLEEAGSVIGRRPMRAGRVGARLNYLTATVLFQERKIPAGHEALNAAMNYMLHGSHWLYQLQHLDNLFTGGQITTRGPLTPRIAMELYASLLGDPQPGDWALRPMESLSLLRTPHPVSMEHWFLVALERKDHEAALEITDRARRHRFFSSLSYGGRLQSLRWILEAPEEVLGQEARLNRQDLLAAYPAYARLSQEASQLRAALDAVPLVPDDPDAFRLLQTQLGALDALSLSQEAVLREMAVRREAAAMVFPPVRSTKEVQAALPEGNVLLAFFAVGGDLYGFLMNGEQYHYWRVPSTPVLAKRIAGMLRSMGHFEQNRELSLKDLADSQWKEAARDVLSSILEGSRADFTASFPELVIVPDGLLWYVPFESLLVDVDGQLRPLISRFRIRYAPTVALAVPDGRGRSPATKTAVVVGRLHPRDEDTVAAAAFDDLARVVPRCTALRKAPLAGPSAVYGSLMDQLIVLADVNPEDRGPYAWAPVPIDGNKPGNLLSDWLALPWQGPGTVILPGYHTAAESSLKGVGKVAPGAEVFLAVCGLMSSGARTILISRWRSGGQSSFDLVREFAQELPHTTPADAWQRAVLVVTDSQLNLEAEPRIKRAAAADPPKATHPFFWAGPMLVDSGVLPEQPEAGPGAERGPKPEAPAAKPEAPKEREPEQAEDPQPKEPKNP
ncbi:MAG: CHAT domain-containing protein, partial [Planctomycetota bacterium]